MRRLTLACFISALALTFPYPISADVVSEGGKKVDLGSTLMEWVKVSVDYNAERELPTNDALAEAPAKALEVTDFTEVTPLDVLHSFVHRAYTFTTINNTNAVEGLFVTVAIDNELYVAFIATTNDLEQNVWLDPFLEYLVDSINNDEFGDTAPYFDQGTPIATPEDDDDEIPDDDDGVIA